ncbi:hypothetical protein ES705_45671 [subsurface metagenome]
MKNYDKRVKQTRILLSDYFILKALSQRTGVSMSSALHKLIKNAAQLPLPEAEPELRQTASMSATVFRAAPAFRIAPVTAITTNGSKAAAFGIKPKGVRSV